MKVIRNGKIILPNSDGKFFFAENKEVAFDEKILQIENKIDAEEIIDAENFFVAPGFINIHIHGAAGFDTMDDSADALKNICNFLPSTGVTSFLPTTMTMPLEKIKNVLKKIRAQSKNFFGAKILGANLEGPFISEKFCGAQDKKNILQADFEIFSDFADIIKIITIAPEEIPNKKFIDKCLEKNIIVSIGHSAATYETALETIQRGASHITHLFNAQTGLHHRQPGIVGAALNSNALVELIADNIHVHPAAQKILSKVKPISEIILITDSLRACGLGDGESELGGQKVFVKGNLATLADGTIAASVAKMNDVVKNFYNNTDFSLPEVIETVTKNPACELKIFDKVGSIEIGKAADFVIFDKNFSVKKTFVNGREIFCG